MDPDVLLKSGRPDAKSGHDPRTCVMPIACPGEEARSACRVITDNQEQAVTCSGPVFAQGCAACQYAQAIPWADGREIIKFMAFRPDAVPMPAAVAARPRDARGYPVPAITPWPDGKPEFARLGSFRTLICLAERRCTVCGTKMTGGPVYRVVDGDMASGIALALEAEKLYFNAEPAHEGPGHRSCMLYSAVVCPHLTSPGSRRKFETSMGSETLPKGDPRGEDAAVVGYDGYTYHVTREEGLAIRFGQPVELLSYDNGVELIDESTAEIARESGNVQRCPPYLLDDDAVAEKAAKAIMMASYGSRPGSAARHEEQARKNRRKATRAARRKNR